MRAYAVFVAPEPMPYSIYERLERKRVNVNNNDVMEDVELNDWLQDMHCRAVVDAVKAQARYRAD